MLVLSLLREYHFYNCESSGVADRALSKTFKWIDFKRLIRYSNSLVRATLSEQAGRDFNAPFNLTGIESGLDSITVTSETRLLCLKTFIKVKKGRFEEVLIKKMTAAEKHFVWWQTSHHTNPNRAISGNESSENISRITPSLFATSPEILHNICRHVASLNNPILETRWLQMMGMSRESISLVRNWILDYYEYDVADDGLKTKVTSLYTNSPTDYILLKTYIRLVEHYKQDSVIHLPITWTQRQLLVLRANLDIPTWLPTPSILGVGYICDGCLRWANPVIPTPDTYDAIVEYELKTGEFYQAPAYSTHLATALYSAVDGQTYCSSAGTCRKRKRDKGKKNHSSSHVDYADLVPELEDVDNLLDYVLDQESALVADDQLVGVDECIDTTQPTKASNFINLVISNAIKHKFSCQYPLRTIDMIGKWVRVKRFLYGLCVYCGHLTQVTNDRITNHGLTCLRHLLPEYGEDHPIRLALGLHEAPTRRRRLATANLSVCDICNGKFRKIHVVHCLSADYDLVVLAICAADYKFCKQTLQGKLCLIYDMRRRRQSRSTQ
jgi:hypothetical protein